MKLLMILFTIMAVQAEETKGYKDSMLHSPLGFLGKATIGSLAANVATTDKIKMIEVFKASRKLEQIEKFPTNDELVARIEKLRAELGDRPFITNYSDERIKEMAKPITKPITTTTTTTTTTVTMIMPKQYELMSEYEKHFTSEIEKFDRTSSITTQVVESEEPVITLRILNREQKAKILELQKLLKIQMKNGAPDSAQKAKALYDATIRVENAMYQKIHWGQRVIPAFVAFAFLGLSVYDLVLLFEK